MYRELELIVKFYNEIHQGTLSIGMTVVCSFVFVTGLYTCIALHSVVVLPLLLILASGIFDVLIIIFEMDGALKSQTFSISESLIAEVKRIKGVVENPFLRRQVMSWRIIRICLGESASYYKNTTSLNIMGFNVNQTINLLLL